MRKLICASLIINSASPVIQSVKIEEKVPLNFRKSLNAVIEEIHDKVTVDTVISVQKRLLVQNRYTQETETITSDKSFMGEAATYKLSEWCIRSINDMLITFAGQDDEEEVIEPQTNKEPNLGESKLRTDGCDVKVHAERKAPNVVIPEDVKVDIGRRGVPHRGAVAKKRPSYATLREIYMEHDNHKGKFINACIRRYGISNSGGNKWYKSMMAVCYRYVDKYNQWPGNEVVLAYYTNKVPRKRIKARHNLDFCTIDIWLLVAKMILVEHPDAELYDLPATHANTVKPSNDELKALYLKFHGDRQNMLVHFMRVHGVSTGTADIWYTIAKGLNGYLPRLDKYPGDKELLAMFCNKMSDSAIGKRCGVARYIATTWRLYVVSKFNDNSKRG